MSKARRFSATGSATSSPESADGPTPSGSLDGRKTAKSGPVRVPASRSASPASARGPATSATSGPSSCDSSPSAALQRCLESKLRARLDENGSVEYALTWKHWDMPSGAPICALRASARRTSDNDCSGWPTPLSRDARSGRRRAPRPNTAGRPLNEMAMPAPAGWPTPTAGDADRGRRVRDKKRGPLMSECVHGWATPTSSKSLQANEAAVANEARRLHPRGQYTTATQAVGTTPSSSFAETGRPVGLNPALPRWLLGFPPTWDDCAAMATPLFPS